MTSRALLFFFLLPPTGACGPSAQAPLAPSPGRPVLTVLTFNVNYGLRDAPENLDAIRDADADLVLLQETTPELEAAADRQLRELYPHQRFRHCCGAGGLGVLSKHAVEEGPYLESPAGWFPGWWVRVDSPLGRVQALLVHLRPPVSDDGSWVKGYFTTGDVRRRELAAYLEHRDPELPTLVAGDFNEARGPALELLAAEGLVDALASFAPGEPTFRWRTSLGTLRFVLDHLFHDEGLRALDAEVLDSGVSDHLPVKVCLQAAVSD
ncbi:MAG: endonuclease/exonuclease/phosphatase family protein [Deltaproteobacteria bacterium]|nr:endonuclease/exonuclease/phosphatase family protein [Deltaproteobacteria bacterium]